MLPHFCYNKGLRNPALVPSHAIPLLLWLVTLGPAGCWCRNPGATGAHAQAVPSSHLDSLPRALGATPEGLRVLAWGSPTAPHSPAPAPTMTLVNMGNKENALMIIVDAQKDFNQKTARLTAQILVLPWPPLGEAQRLWFPLAETFSATQGAVAPSLLRGPVTLGDPQRFTEGNVTVMGIKVTAQVLVGANVCYAQGVVAHLALVVPKPMPGTAWKILAPENLKKSVQGFVQQTKAPPEFCTQEYVEQWKEVEGWVFYQPQG